MRTKTEPCPFCGSIRQELRECAGYALVACKECGASGQMCVGPNQAIKSWNLRYKEDDIFGNSRGSMPSDALAVHWGLVDYSVTRSDLSCSE